MDLAALHEKVISLTAEIITLKSEKEVLEKSKEELETKLKEKDNEVLSLESLLQKQQLKLTQQSTKLERLEISTRESAATAMSSSRSESGRKLLNKTNNKRASPLPRLYLYDFPACSNGS